MSSSPTPEFHQFISYFNVPVEFIFPSNYPSKEGPLPASKSALDALPTVTVTEEEDCIICLTEYDEAKELPCKHRFHSDCIMNWLGMHGSCPVCRYEMPVEEMEEDVVRWEVMIMVRNGYRVRVDSDSIEEEEENNGSGIQDIDRENTQYNHDSMDDLD